MKFKSAIIATLSLMSLNYSMADNQKDTKQAIVKHIESNILLQDHDDFGSKFKKLFPSTKVYKVRMKQENGWTGLGMEAVVHNGKTTIISDNIQLRNHIVSLYKKPLKNEDEIDAFFGAMGSVDEVILKNKLTYHVYTGKKFFGKKSGYLVVLNSDKTIKTCEYELKLSE